MRKLGYTLLFVGFAWISFQQLNGLLRVRLRSVALYATVSPNPSKTYTRDDVRQHVRDTTLATYDLFPVVILPGVIMLLGGLILARSSSGRKRDGAQPTSGSV